MADSETLLLLFLSPGIILSGPFLLEISVKSRRIRAAFLASDFRLDGIGLLTADTQMTSYLKARTTSDMPSGGNWSVPFEAKALASRMCGFTMTPREKLWLSSWCFLWLLGVWITHNGQRTTKNKYQTSIEGAIDVFRSFRDAFNRGLPVLAWSWSRFFLFKGVLYWQSSWEALKEQLMFLQSLQRPSIEASQS